MKPFDYANIIYKHNKSPEWSFKEDLELLQILVSSEHNSRIMNIERLLKSDNTVKRSADVGDGILLAPKQGKKNLAKFLGIDMSALQAEAGEQTLQTGQAGITANTQAGPQLGTAAGSQGM